jgi:SAM-dependent methyltransferase
MVEASMFIDNIIKYLNPRQSAKFLDLGCGKGRHSVYINKKGFCVTGVDLSPENIKLAKQHENELLKFKVHDMREPIINGNFDYILNLFTSFGYFKTIAENRKVLDSASISLKNKGIMLIDFLNADQVIDGLVKTESQVIDGITFNISRSVSEGAIVKKINIVDTDGEHNYFERVKALSRQDFIGMLTQANFEILDTFGNYNLDHFNEKESPRLILIARNLG